MKMVVEVSFVHGFHCTRGRRGLTSAGAVAVRACERGPEAKEASTAQREDDEVVGGREVDGLASERL